MTKTHRKPAWGGIVDADNNVDGLLPVGADVESARVDVGVVIADDPESLLV